MAPKDKDVISRHQVEQWRRWEALRDKLVELKEDKSLGITYTEIATGLDLSRQRLFNFLKDHTQGLPIDRHNILELWDYLTSSTGMDPNLSQKSRKQREQFRQERPHTLDELLEAAGFLSENKGEPPLIIPIERIRSRLLGPWVRNDTILCRLADTIVDTILDKGGFDDPSSSDGGLGKTGLELDAAREIPRKYFDPTIFAKIQKRFYQEIDRFVTLGKVKFYHDELYELYQSILENHTYKSFPTNMLAVECEFQTLSFSISKKTYGNDLNAEIMSICNDCEKKLRPELTSLQDPVFPPTIQVKARFVIDYPDEPKEVVFSYISCGTHVESVMTALSNGMGYALLSVLSLTGFDIRAIGKRSESLARISVTLTEEDKHTNKNSDDNYQGLWVDQNVILGILNSMTYAILSWLSRRLKESDFDEFYSITRRVSEAKRLLYGCLGDIYDYRISALNFELNKDYSYGRLYFEDVNDEEFENFKVLDILRVLSERKIKELVDEIDDLYQKSKKSGDATDKLTEDYFKSYKERLNQKALLAQLAIARSALFECKLDEAGEALREIREKLYVGRFTQFSKELLTPITTLYESEEMLYRLLVGDEEFWNKPEYKGQSLIKNLDLMIRDLRIYSINNNTGIIDFDVFLSAGQLFGIVGLSKFYFSTNKKELENAFPLLIKAAYFSAKLGHRQRVSRCLCYASRICCRLGKFKKSDAITNLVDELFNEKRGEIFNFYNTQDFLAKGERLLLSSDGDESIDNVKKALKYFLASWQKAKLNTFHRSVVGSLYNLARAIDKIAANSQIKDVKSLVKELANEDTHPEIHLGLRESSNLDVDTDRDKIDYPGIFYGSLKTCFKIADISKDVDKKSLEEVSQKLKEHVSDILNEWHQKLDKAGSQHPFSKMIENRTFLEKVI